MTSQKVASRIATRTDLFRHIGCKEASHRCVAFFFSPIDFMLRMNLRKQYNMIMELLKSLFAAVVALAASSLQAETRPFKNAR